MALSAEGIPVTHLIKGYLRPDLRAMIRPAPHIRLVSVPRPLFRLWLWSLLLWQTLTGQLRWLLIDHERTLGEVSWWCRLWGVSPLVIQQDADGYALWLNGRRVPVQDLFAARP